MTISIRNQMYVIRSPGTLIKKPHNTHVKYYHISHADRQFAQSKHR